MLHQAHEILSSLKALSLPERAQAVSRFFKTGQGDYAQNDVFLGISMPEIHTMAKFYEPSIQLDQLAILITYPEHEARMLAIIILVRQYQNKKSTEIFKQKIIDFYLQNTQYINNWDLVDQSAYKILGHYCCLHQEDRILQNLAISQNFWEQRIATVGCLFYIKKSEFKLALELISLNLKHPESLMQKANGWMLREIGKKKPDILLQFIEQHIAIMPRTTLRYAIERLEEKQRQYFLKL